MINFQKSISPEEIQELPLIAFEKEIFVIESKEQIDIAYNYLKLQTVLGFDTETKPCFKKGQKNEVAMLQLATREKAFLFRLNKMKLESNIRKILSDSTIIKVGVAIKDDLNALKKKAGFEPHSFVDLQEMVKKYGIQSFSLQKLAAIVLGLRISKSKRLSNWEADVLNEPQLKYAATDAWAAFEIYKRLVNSSL